VRTPLSEQGPEDAKGLAMIENLDKNTATGQIDRSKWPFKTL
jgi:hypothetical protein